MKKIIVSAGNDKYPVFIGKNIQKFITDHIKKNTATGSKAVVITNDTVDSLYPDYFKSVFEGTDRVFKKVVLKDGEEYKSPESLDAIYHHLLESSIHRDDLVIAFGGGVIGDLAGFAAATYNRGTNLIHVPTTIVSQVDSSIGGKVGINYKKVKNIIGTFYQPDAVFIDPVFLKTLEENEIINGSAEILKYGILFSGSILDSINKNMDIDSEERLFEMVSSGWFEKIIISCVKNKAMVVSKDVYDRNYRNLLNFGHTVGHSLEKVFNLDKVKHGEAVSMGMMVAINISIDMGFTGKDLMEYITGLYSLLKLPEKIPESDLDSIIEILKFDKKTTSGKMRFILLKGINKPFIYEDLDKEIIIDNIKKCMYNYV